MKIKTQQGSFDIAELLLVEYNSSKPKDGCTVWLNADIDPSTFLSIDALKKAAKRKITFTGKCAEKVTNIIAQWEEVQATYEPQAETPQGDK